MLRSKITEESKGWAVGPWNSSADFAVGWAREPRDVPHLHERVSEVYIVVAGTGTLLGGSSEHDAGPGDVFFIKPGEPHGWLRTSPDFLIFMVHCPVDPSDKRLISPGE